MSRFASAIVGLLLLCSTASHAAITVREIPPASIDPATQQIHGPHLWVYDSAAAPNGLLVISIGGTGSSPSESLPVDTEAAHEGFWILAIDYPDNVITTVCRSSSHKNCFDRFREAIVLGKPVSPVVKVDRGNSIEYRIESTIVRLSAREPGWSRFIKNGSVNWSKVVLIGHSQGSGHAAFLAKIHDVHAVIMTAGPQDSWNGVPAPWIYSTSATPGSRFYSFLHEEDPFGSAGQIAIARVLTQSPGMPIFEITNETQIPPAAHIWVATKPESDPHNSLIQDHAFQWVWDELFERGLDRTVPKFSPRKGVTAGRDQRDVLMKRAAREHPFPSTLGEA